MKKWFYFRVRGRLLGIWVPSMPQNMRALTMFQVPPGRFNDWSVRTPYKLRRQRLPKLDAAFAIGLFMG